MTNGKNKKNILMIPKLEDANFAGSKSGYKCKLIVVEGDSAKTFAISGLQIIGRDYYGVFPLKGKPKNIKELSEKKNNKINYK